MLHFKTVYALSENYNLGVVLFTEPPLLLVIQERKYEL